MQLGECVKELRLAAGLLQRELADSVGISSSMLSLIEAGKREPAISVLRSIGKALEVPTSVLFAAALSESDYPASSVDAIRNRRLTEELISTAIHALRARRALENAKRHRAG